VPRSGSPLNRVSPERLEAILERIRSVRVLVVGDVMLDVYLRGGASRISPEAPVPVVRVAEEWRSVGGAANVAANAGVLGARVDVVGCVGDDAAGSSLTAELESMGIGVAGLCIDAGRATTVKTRVLVHHNQVARYDRESDEPISEALVAEIAARIDALAALADVIVLEDYNKGVLVPAVIRAAIAAAERHGKPVVVDPKYRHFFEYAGVTVFKPNLVELQAALQADAHPDDAAWLDSARARLGCENLLVTLGEAGMALIAADGEYVRVPAVARAVYDVSGAGDTVTASLAAAIAAGATVAEAAIIANHAAAIEVGKAGVATVTPDELREAMARAREEGLFDAGASPAH
jgi:rfaE bifunctional protein kinase chain/domain